MIIANRICSSLFGVPWPLMWENDKNIRIYSGKVSLSNGTF